MASVLIIAPQNDVHALAVAERIQQRGQKALIVDSRWLNNELFSYDINCNSHLLEWKGHRIDPTSIWWRRAHSPTTASPDYNVQKFVVAEKRSALFGSLHSAGCPIFNDPARETLANLKPYQLAVARQIGLQIPRTIITNDYKAMIQFRDSCKARSKRCIYKSLTPCPTHLGETRLVDDQLQPEELIMAPVIFQECIERGRDIRVFIANSKVFSVNVLTQHEELIDWRLDPLCTYEPTKLHKAVEAKLKMLLSRLVLHTGSIDLREDSGGELFFLEINPSGQFLFLESDANLPVTAAIADLLLSPSLTKKNRTVKQ